MIHSRVADGGTLATLAISPPAREPLFAGQHRGFAVMFVLATCQVAAGAALSQKSFLDFIDITIARQFTMLVFAMILWVTYRHIEAMRKNISASTSSCRWTAARSTPGGSVQMSGASFVSCAEHGDRNT